MSPSTEAAGRCSVLRCSGPEEFHWSTGETRDEHFEWPVCRVHFDKLRSGVQWATHNERPDSAQQWIVMGSDLDVRKSEELTDSSVSVEFTETGREVRLEFTTLREHFDVVLDDDQALDLGITVTDVSADDELRPAPGANGRS